MITETVIHKYLRPKKEFPHVWCAGCGIGIVLGSIIRAIDKLSIPKDDIVMVSGIGCTGRMPVYVDFNTLHTTHGRALTFATGIKHYKPRLKGIAVMGDGDGVAIGGNHFIHACRRNLNITTIIVNNFIYGMTGGQRSPTTPPGHVSTTSPFGSEAEPFDICDLAAAGGASFVARSTVYHSALLDRLVKKALTHDGFSVVEALSPCYTAYGRRNDFRNAVEMMADLRDRAVHIKKQDTSLPPLPDRKFYIGIYKDEDKPEFTAAYKRLMKRVREIDSPPGEEKEQ